MHKKRKSLGLAPGSIVFTGNQKVEKVIIHYLNYNSTNLIEKTIHTHKEVTFHPSRDEEIDWYDLRGLHDVSLIETIGNHFVIHPLVLEDIVDIQQRPKFEEYENGSFIILRALHFDSSRKKVKTEQLAIYFQKGLLVSFQETESDLFESVRIRLQSGKGRIRSRGADYLAYALMDSVVDNYFLILDAIHAEIVRIEDQLLLNPENFIKEDIHALKKELLIVRRSIAPLREAISRFAKSEAKFMDESTFIYLRDLYDHSVQIMDTSETYRDLLNGLQDLYISEISFKMNQVMQVLTIITTIFVPLSFLAGLYGMNFVNIPELQYKNGYYVLLIVMAIILIGSLIFFRKKKWF